ncbi:MAG: AraC family transcriptional regulator [Acutalibacter sp.]|jgi:AraC-like DNA-binding protein
MHAFFETRNEPLSAHVSTELTFPLHLHPQLELFLLLKGRSAVTVRGQSRVVEPGSLVLIFPNQVHSYTSLEPGTQAILVVCDLAYTGGYGDTLLRSHPEDPFLTAEKVHSNASYAIQELEKEHRRQRQSPVFPPLVQLVLARCLPELTLERNQASDHRDLTYQISHYVGEHFREPLTLGALAHQLGMNKYHLSHVFSEKMGQSFPAYLARIRLSCACSALSETEMSVTQVAEECGFESQRSFFRVFRQQMGKTPLQYRREARSGQDSVL